MLAIGVARVPPAPPRLPDAAVRARPRARRHPRQEPAPRPHAVRRRLLPFFTRPICALLFADHGVHDADVLCRVQPRRYARRDGDRRRAAVAAAGTPGIRTKPGTHHENDTHRHHHERRHRTHGHQPAPRALDLRDPRAGRRRARATARAIMPDPILVGRNADKLEALAQAHGVERWTTDLDAALADRDDTIYFDAASTGLRADADPQGDRRRQAHLLREADRDDARRGARPVPARAKRAGVKHGVVQDKLWLPGLLKLKMLIDTRLLRPHPVGARRVRLLGVRRRLAAGAAPVVELPQGGRRRHHRRHAVPLALRARQPVRRGEGGVVPRRHAHPAALGRARQAVRGDRRRCRVRDVRARRRRRSRSSTARGARACAATICSRSRSTARTAPRSPVCADCCDRSRARRRRSRCGIRTSRRRSTSTRRWQKVPDNRAYDNAFKVAVGAVPAPRRRRRRRSAGTCSKARKACSSPSSGCKSWAERRWLDVPALDA